ncbi:Mbeg1-like protein [uncultured Parvimonas sp.]|uniref:Mbeg1-like protein n=1 Tax=Parvimonas parva TaxID=2769485 RepID=UPI0028047A51|nr:Mbeg1-like protein [uncultured Parvimonas sp.]
MFDLNTFLILNCIIYVGDFEKENANEKFLDKNIFEISSNLKIEKDSSGDYPAEINEEEFNNILNTIKSNKELYEKIKIVDIENSISANISGDEKIVNVSFIFENNLIIVYKGTAGDFEWKDNVESTYNVTDTKQQRRALMYFDKIVEKFKEVEKIYVSGHSKGGNKAQYIGVLRGDMSKLEMIYSFDGQGFNNNFIKKYNKEITNNRHKIFNICNELDYVNIILFSISNKIFIKSTTNVGNENDRQSKIKHRFGGIHSPYSMFKNKDGVLYLNDEVEQSEIMKNFEKLFEYYNTNMECEDNKYMYFRMSLFMMKEGEKVFGEEYKEPKGFFKRFIKLTRDFTKNENELSFSQIIKLFKPILSDVSSIIFVGEISENAPEKNT